MKAGGIKRRCLDEVRLAVGCHQPQLAAGADARREDGIHMRAKLFRGLFHALQPVLPARTTQRRRILAVTGKERRVKRCNRVSRTAGQPGASLRVPRSVVDQKHAASVLALLMEGQAIKLHGGSRPASFPEP